MSKIGLFLGTGSFPRLLIQNLKKQEYSFFCLALRGFTDPDIVENEEHEWFSLGEVSKMIKTLHLHGISIVTMAGGGQKARPSFKNLKLDRGGLKLLSRIGFRWLGDNRILKIVADFVEEEGFFLKAPQEFFPSLLAPAGALGHCRPNEESVKDGTFGQLVLNHLSALDFGQGVAIQNGLVLGIEAAEGTDECIRRCGLLQSCEENPATYIKRAKCQQDERLDLPVIGPKTIDSLKDAGFGGMFFQAEKTLLLMPEETIDRAEKASLFLWGEP